MIMAKAKACRVEKTLILKPLKGTLVATRERTLMTRKVNSLFHGRLVYVQSLSKGSTFLGAIFTSCHFPFCLSESKTQVKGHRSVYISLC